MGGRRARRIGFFAYYYPPLGGAGSLRALSFARHLPALGWEVAVITPREGVYGVDPSLEGEGWPGVEVIRTGTWEPSVLLKRFRGKGGEGDSTRGGAFVEEARVGRVGAAVRQAVRRTLYFPDSARGWVRHAVASARKAHARAPFAALLSSSPPVSAHAAAARAAEELGVPWVADWRDPWSEAFPEGSPHRAKALRLERELLGSATAVVAATAGLASLLGGQRGPGPAPTLVRNGWEPADFPGDAGVPAADPPEIVFAGSHHGPRQDLAGFLAAVARLRARRALVLRFLGKVDASLHEAVRAAGVEECVRLEGFATHGEVVRAMAGASVLLLPAWSEDTRRGRLVCPAKTTEYLAAGRPILALAHPASEAAEFLRGFDGVRIHRFEDSAGIGSSLEALLARPAPRTAVGRDLAGLTRAAQAAILSRVLDDAVAGRSA